jgi:hypothetical protein
MMRVATGIPLLGEATSFLQVEFGLAELQASWAGFVDTSVNYGLSFNNRKHICNEFAIALADYINFLEESSPLQVGR